MPRTHAVGFFEFDLFGSYMVLNKRYFAIIKKRALDNTISGK
jgi:hypothetical protein